MRVVLWVVLALFIVKAEAQVDPKPRRVILEITSDYTCTHPAPSGVVADRNTTIEQVTILLPHSNGPFTGNGTYHLKGTGWGGYTMAGRSVVTGQFQDPMLIVEKEQWYYEGKPMNTIPQTVQVEARSGARAVADFVVSTPDMVPCNGKKRYLVKTPAERWKVTVNTFNKLGYGDSRRNFGVEIHTKRVFDIFIDNEQIERVTADISFVSIRPFSQPPALYQCKGVSAKVAGTGTDVEAERYDQVRHASRFHSQMKPEDAAVLEEWKKIKMHDTPYAFPQPYAATATKNQDKLHLFPEKSSGYVVSHRCDPDVKFISEWKAKFRKKWKAHERWSRLSYDRFLFPEQIDVLLKHGWTAERNYKTKYHGPNVGWQKATPGVPGDPWPNTDHIHVEQID